MHDIFYCLMIAVDTDILINFLTGKDVESIEKLFRSLEAKKMKILLPAEVILELVLLLEKEFNWQREDIYKVIYTLLNDPLFKSFEKDELINAIKIYKDSGISFTDAMKIMYEDVDEIISYNKDFQKAGIRLRKPTKSKKR